LIQVPLISSLTPAAKAAAFDALDLEIVNMYCYGWWARAMGGLQSPSGVSLGRHREKFISSALKVRQLLDAKGLKLIEDMNPVA
jgi:hypothetical protein